MKKLWKKLAAAVLTAAMAVSMAFGAMADTSDEAQTYSLTITNTGETAHTLELYQIFTGDVSNLSEGSGTLSNVQWGNGITDAGKTALGDAAAKAASITDAKAFAKEIELYLTNRKSSTSVAAGKSYTFDKLQAGYYLVKDEDGSQSGKESGAYTSYMVQVVGDTTVNTKLDVPTVVKKVKDTNDSTGETTGWQDSADYDIGDTVPYQITGTMPQNIDDYTTYKYEFTDTMSKGLTYTAKNATIKIKDTDVTSYFTETVTPNADGSTTVTWSCDNLKDIANVTLNKDTTVVVTYSCTLNTNAVIGSAGNPNTVNLTYSNNPNKGGKGDTGKTPDDKNIVFTYKLIVNKVEPATEPNVTKPLSGAEFELYKIVKDSDNKEELKKLKLVKDPEDNTKFTATGLDDGTYVLKETKTPEGYNKIADKHFKITAGHDAESDTPGLTSLSAEGMNGDTIEFNVVRDSGSLTTNIVNVKGSRLPVTGGIGTTIFYVAGSILVIGAAIVLFVRRHHNA